MAILGPSDRAEQTRTVAAPNQNHKWGRFGWSRSKMPPNCGGGKSRAAAKLDYLSRAETLLQGGEAEGDTGSFEAKRGNRTPWAFGAVNMGFRPVPRHAESPASSCREQEEIGRCHGGWGTPRAEGRREDTAPPQWPFGAMQAGRTYEVAAQQPGHPQVSQTSPDLSGPPGPIGGPSSCTREAERSGELPSQRSRTGCELQRSATPPARGGSLPAG